MNGKLLRKRGWQKGRLLANLLVRFLAEGRLGVVRHQGREDSLNWFRRVLVKDLCGPSRDGALGGGLARRRRHTGSRRVCWAVRPGKLLGQSGSAVRTSSRELFN